MERRKSHQQQHHHPTTTITSTTTTNNEPNLEFESRIQNDSHSLTYTHKIRPDRSARLKTVTIYHAQLLWGAIRSLVVLVSSGFVLLLCAYVLSYAYYGYLVHATGFPFRSIQPIVFALLLPFSPCFDLFDLNRYTYWNGFCSDFVSLIMFGFDFVFIVVVVILDTNNVISVFIIVTKSYRTMYVLWNRNKIAKTMKTQTISMNELNVEERRLCVCVCVLLFRCLSLFLSSFLQLSVETITRFDIEYIIMRQENSEPDITHTHTERTIFLLLFSRCEDNLDTSFTRYMPPKRNEPSYNAYTSHWRWLLRNNRIIEKTMCVSYNNELCQSRE